MLELCLELLPVHVIDSLGDLVVFVTAYIGDGIVFALKGDMDALYFREWIRYGNLVGRAICFLFFNCQELAVDIFFTVFHPQREFGGGKNGICDRKKQEKGQDGYDE